MNKHIHHQGQNFSCLKGSRVAPRNPSLSIALYISLGFFIACLKGKMHYHILGLCSIVFLGTLIAHVHANTSSGDVSALNVMYNSLSSRSKLSSWKSSGGDPCGDSWEGIECSGSSVTKIDLSGFGLTGSLGYQLSNLKSVTYFDVSKNKLQNDIPYQLPPNLEHLDLSENSFSNNVPYSISMMSDLTYLNLGHNQLNGGLNDMFKNLSKLTEMNLSFNKLTGDLPKSMEDLKSLSKLSLQNNQFSGSINVLAKLSKLEDLNVENNKFTGWIPDELKSINNLQTKGNSWSSGPAPPGFSKHRKEGKETDGGGISGLSGIAIGGIVLGVVAILVVGATLVSRRYSSSHLIDDDRTSDRRATTPLTSPGVSGELRSASRKEFRNDFSPIIGLKALKSMNSSTSTDGKSSQRCPSDDPRSSVSDIMPLPGDTEVAKGLNGSRNNSIHPASYSLAELQTATGNFAPGRLLGQGTIGWVYRAKYADGKVLAVKKIESSLCQRMKPEAFTEVIATIATLKHPHVAQLVGYCTDQGHNMLVYEYFRNGSIHEFLHLSDDFSKPLTWNTRVKIALDTARAIEYLHEGRSPPIVHKNIKSSNIFLDMELSPCLSDCGLAHFYQRTSQNLGTGYNAPECTKPSAYTLKSDVYSFGVVMLEILTGRQPFDSSKPRQEQCLVRWATPQLHDLEALEKMVDPALRGLYPPPSVSRFADIISLCVQPEPEFRPPISEVVESLVRLAQSQA